MKWKVESSSNWSLVPGDSELGKIGASPAGKRQASEDFIAHVAKFAKIIEKDTALQARLGMEYDYVDEFGAARRLLRSDNIVLFVQEAKRRGLEFTKQEAMAYYDEAYQQNLREGR